MNKRCRIDDVKSFDDVADSIRRISCAIFILLVILSIFAFLVCFCLWYFNETTATASAEVDSLSTDTDYLFSSVDTLSKSRIDMILEFSSPTGSGDGFAGSISSTSNNLLFLFDQIDYVNTSNLFNLTFVNTSSPTTNLSILYFYSSGIASISSISFVGENDEFDYNLPFSCTVNFSRLRDATDYYLEIYDLLVLMLSPASNPDPDPDPVPTPVCSISAVDDVSYGMYIAGYSTIFENNDFHDGMSCDEVALTFFKVDHPEECNGMVYGDYPVVTFYVKVFTNTGHITKQMYAISYDGGDTFIFCLALSPDITFLNLDYTMAFDIETTYAFSLNTDSSGYALAQSNYNFLYSDFIKYYRYDNLLTYQHYFDLGVAAGEARDQTLISIMWDTFSFPFKLLFGNYDRPSQSYVGGLFNFTLLGVDVRAFVLGILSFCVVLAIIRLVMGAK